MVLHFVVQDSGISVEKVPEGKKGLQTRKTRKKGQWIIETGEFEEK